MSLPFFLCGEASFQQVDPVSNGGKKPAEIKVVLFGQDFGRRHDGDLVSIFHRNDGGLGRDNGFPRSDIPLKQAAHRVRGADVIGNVLERALLGLGRVKGEDLFIANRMLSPS